MIKGSHKSDKPINITGIDKIHLKCDCIRGSIVIGIQEPILYSYALLSPPGHKIIKEPRVKLLKKINKSVLSHITFYFEDDDYKPVDFNGETVSFTCQLIKILKKCTHICVIIFSIYVYINYMGKYNCLYVHLYEYLCVFTFI